MKDNKPNGPLFSPEFRETLKRLKDKEPELEALAGLDDRKESQESEERGKTDAEEETPTDAG
jgi:hypothetical protein